MNKVLLSTLLMVFLLPISLMGSQPTRNDELINEISYLYFRLNNQQIPKFDTLFNASEKALSAYKWKLQMALIEKANKWQPEPAVKDTKATAALQLLKETDSEVIQRKRAKLIDERDKKNLIAQVDEAAQKRDLDFTAVKKELPKADLKVTAEANDKKRKNAVLEKSSNDNGSVATAAPANSTAKPVKAFLCGSAGCDGNFTSREGRRTHWINVHKISRKLVTSNTRFEDLPEKVKEEALQYNKRRIVVGGWKAKKSTAAAAGNVHATVKAAAAAYTVPKFAAAAANANSAPTQARVASAATEQVIKPAEVKPAQTLLPSNHNQGALYNVTQTVHTVTQQHVVYGMHPLHAQANAVLNPAPVFNHPRMNYPAPVFNAIPSTQIAAAALYQTFQAPVMAQQPAASPIATPMPTHAISDRDKFIAGVKVQMMLQMVAGGCDVRLVVPFVQALNL